VFFGINTTSAATVSWWRFEAGGDDDGSANGLENANEIGSEPAMISNNAVLGTNAPDLFDTVVPGPNVPNTGSVRSAVNGAGSDGIFGTAAYSSTLDVDSISVEFWMRTTESEAGFVARTTDFNNSGESNTLTNGFRIVEPQNARVNFWVSDANGSNAQQYTLTSGDAVNDGDWHYIAWTYNHTTGEALFYIDDVYNPVASLDTGTNRPLWWGAGTPAPEVQIGYRMDGNPNNNTGTLDEIRFTDLALPPGELLAVPEASQTAAVIVLIIIFFGLRPRRNTTT
jgi:hypothetical protein